MLASLGLEKATDFDTPTASTWTRPTGNSAS